MFLAYLIGEPCKYDEDCFVEHSYCEMQQICQCKDNFIETEDRETCIAMVGAYCHSKYDCISLPNSVCKEDRCVCDTGYVSDSHSSKCMPVAKHLEGPCESDAQCTLGFGKQSRCINGRCACNHGFHFDGYCLENKGLGMICRNSSECYIGENYRNTIACNGGHCSCKDGYLEYEGNACISGSEKHFTSCNALMFLCGAFLLMRTRAKSIFM